MEIVATRVHREFSSQGAEASRTSPDPALKLPLTIQSARIDAKVGSQNAAFQATGRGIWLTPSLPTEFLKMSIQCAEAQTSTLGKLTTPHTAAHKLGHQLLNFRTGTSLGRRQLCFCGHPDTSTQSRVHEQVCLLAAGMISAIRSRAPCVVLASILS